MIAIVPTEHGWFIRQEENELGYYSSLPDAMHVAYFEERKTIDHGRVEQGDTSSYDGRPSKSD